MLPGRVAAFGDTNVATGSERLIVLAETRKREPQVLEALRAEINGLVADLAGAPPDEVVLAPPNAIPRTSSGKVRRQASRTLWRAGRIGTDAAPIWQQTLRLQLATAIGRGRDGRCAPAAGCCSRPGVGRCSSWLSPIAWLGALLLPKLSWRWRAIRAASRLLFLATGTPLTVRGLEHLDHRPCVLIANHASYLDVLTIVAALPRPVAFVAKAELGGAWYTRLPMQRIGARFVERFDRRKGLEDYRQIAAAARAGHSPLFFPEGTFRRAPGLMPFRMGAFACAVEAKLPVIPVALRGTRAILPSGSWFPRHGRIEVTVAAATAVGDADERWAAALALRDQVRATMLALTGERDATQCRTATDRRLCPLPFRRRRIEDNDFVGKAVVEQPACRLVEHVRIETLRVEQVDAALQRLPLLAGAVEFTPRDSYFVLQRPQRKHAAVAVHAVPGEV